MFTVALVINTTEQKYKLTACVMFSANFVFYFGLSVTIYFIVLLYNTNLIFTLEPIPEKTVCVNLAFENLTHFKHIYYYYTMLIALYLIGMYLK